MLKSSIWTPKAPVSLARPSAAIIPRSSLSPKARVLAPSTTSLISPPRSVDGQTSSDNLSIKAPAFEPTNLKTTRAASAAVPRPTRADIYTAMRATNSNTSNLTVTACIARSTVPITPQGSVSGGVPTVTSLSPNSSVVDLPITNATRSVSASAATTRPTNDNIYAAMRAANPVVSASAPIITSSTSATAPSSVGSNVPTVTSLSPKSPIIAASRVEATRSVSASTTITRPTYDNLYDAMIAANPRVSIPAPAACLSTFPTPSSGSDDGEASHSSSSPKATAFKPSNTSTSTINKERPLTTAVVARRMIVQALSIKAKEKGNASTDGESRDCDTLEEKRSGLMVIGLGGSRWASPEERAKAVPRPIEEFWEVQRQGQDKYNKMVNETMSLRFDRAPVVPLKVETPHRRITREDIMAAMRAAAVKV